MPRRKTVIDRYERSEEGHLFLDVWVPSAAHLYNDFDRTVPYLKKDLDQEFVDYLTDSVREIRNHDFVVRLSMPQMPDEQVKDESARALRPFTLTLTSLRRAPSGQCSDARCSCF